VSQSIDTGSPPGSDQGSGEHLRVQAALPLEDDGPAATGVSARPLRGRWIEVDRYTRGDLRAHRDWVYIFGDNELGEGRGGQAGAARGEVNGLGIPTKRAPGTQAADYWGDATLAHNVAVLQGPLRRLENLILEGWTVVMPAAGVGTGLAMLPTRAPLTFAYLSHRLAALRSLAAAGDER
jgi:hypothetical protein